MSTVKLGLPKGSLESATIELFEKAGWKIKPAARNYFRKLTIPSLIALFAGHRRCPDTLKAACSMLV
jgi:ATP phosphoribosyltransferase